MRQEYGSRKTESRNTRYYALRIAIMLIIILDTIRRMLYGARPIDLTTLIVEILVLLLIFYEIVSDRLQRWKTKRRLKTISKCMIEGRSLQDKVPTTNANQARLSEWRRQVEDWIPSTDKQLSHYSSHASASFLQDNGNMSQPACPVAPALVGVYSTLQLRLNNLRSILENPGTYLM